MDWKIEQRKNGSVFVYSGYSINLWFMGPIFVRQKVLSPAFISGPPELDPLFLMSHRSGFSSVDRAKAAIKAYLDSIEVEKTYSVEILEND